MEFVSSDFSYHFELNFTVIYPYRVVLVQLTCGTSDALAYSLPLVCLRFMVFHHCGTFCSRHGEGSRIAVGCAVAGSHNGQQPPVVR